MGLKIWLPLIKDTNNIGLSNINFTNTAATLQSTGKLGRSYYFNGSAYLAENTYDWSNFNTSQFSLCCWYKEPSPVASGNSQIICLGTSSGWPNIRIGLLRRMTNGFPMFSVSDGSNSINYNFTASTFSLDTWNHIAVTYNNGALRMYINGILDKTYTTTIIPVLNSSQHLGIGAAPDGKEKLTGYLNDVRFYDNVLSDEEVREIAQALVCHYKLDGFNAGASENILLGSKSFPTYQATTNQYISKRRSDDVYQVRTDGMTEVVTSGSSWGGLGVFANTFNFAPGDILTYSVWAYYSDMTNPTLSFYPMIFNSGGARDTTITMPIYLSTGDTWVSANSRSFGNISSATSPKLFWAAFEWTAGMKSILDNGGRIELTMQSSGTWGSDSKIMLFAPKLEYGYNPNPVWTPALSESGISTTKIVDSSGYGNNGFTVGSPQPIRDSIRHSYCMHFTNTQAARSERASVSFLPTETLTLNLWTRMQTWGNPISCTEGGGWNIENTGGSVNFPVYVKGTGYKHAYTGLSTSFFTDGQWHMITVTYDTQYAKIYVDGEYKGQDTTGNVIQYAGTAPLVISGEAENTSDITVGGINDKTMVGEVSDVRIYATVLSEDDIRQLYKVRAKVDNGQNMYSFDYAETSRELLTGIPYTTSYGTHSRTSNIFTDYDINGELTLSGASRTIGSDYIPISPAGKTYYYDIVVSIDANNQFDLGFERYDANKTPRSNSSCVYAIAIKPSSDIVKKRYFGTIDLSTDGVNPAAYIALRILNGWNNTTGSATVHYLSLREVSTIQQPKLTDTGVFSTEELREYAKAALYNDGIVEGHTLIEI